VIEISAGGSVAIDGVVHTNAVTTNCYEIHFGAQPSVQDSLSPQFHALLQQMEEFPNSVLVVLKSCLGDNEELAGITINNHEDGSQEVLVQVDTVLTDTTAAYNAELSGFCGNADGDLSNDNPEDDSKQELPQSESLFSTDHPTAGKGCTDSHFLVAADTKCPHKNNARLWRMEGMSENECYLECADHESCDYFSWAPEGQSKDFAWVAKHMQGKDTVVSISTKCAKGKSNLLRRWHHVLMDIASSNLTRNATTKVQTGCGAWKMRLSSLVTRNVHRTASACSSRSVGHLRVIQASAWVVYTNER